MIANLFGNNSSIASDVQEIGKVVKSNSHIDYICQVYGRGEIGMLPTSADYALGSFVSIALNGDDRYHFAGRLIGVIYNTMLLNPDFGSLGPRLSPQHELEVFSPDYLSETATLVGIMALGWQSADGTWHQGAPLVSATVNLEVMAMADEEIRAFHAQADGSAALRYLPLLLAQNNPLAPTLIFSILDRLALLFPAQQQRFAVVRNNLAWRSIVEPAG